MRRFALEKAISSEELLQGLNEMQRRAVTSTDGPVMIVAGPGSGKTRVLTTRMAYLIGAGHAHPSGILALTFTNKAAREMKERVALLMKSAGLEPPWLGTFHSVFARLLRVEADKLGFTRNFSIYDTDDTERLLRHLMARHHIDGKVIRPRAIRSMISGAKNRVMGPQAFEAEAESLPEQTAARLYRPYTEALRKANALDFDDLLLKPLELFERCPDVLEKYQRRWSHLHIDEYQDTNRVQYLLANRIAARSRNICVVGDDAQSIYAFRGADIKNILSFQKDYPDAEIVRLEQNYRSTKTILRVASASIRNNARQLKKNLWTENAEGAAIPEIATLSEKDEAQKVQDLVRELRLRFDYSYDDFAVLYRTNAQSRALEDTLRTAGVPYQVIGSLSFYQKKEIKDAIAYLRLLVNPGDTVSLRRVINLPRRGIGSRTLERLLGYAEDEGTTAWQAIVERQKVGLPQRAERAVGVFHALMASHAALAGPAETVARSLIREAGLMDDLRKDHTPEGLMRVANIQELLNAVAEFGFSTDGQGTLAGFLQEIALFTDADATEARSGRVTLMTLHASKGMEFPVVFITGLEDKLLPLAAADKNVSMLEEERRLFYVGVTRAKTQLFLLHAMSRFEYGQRSSRSRSRFLEEVEEELSMPEGRVSRVVSGRRASKSTLPSNSATPRESGIVPGAEVEHPIFGRGTVISVTGRIGQHRAVVHFASEGNKNLVLRFARLRVMAPE